MSTVDVIDQIYEEALEHHQAGRLPQAQVIYQRILVEDPTHPGALYLSGVISYQEGKYEIAADLIGRALEEAPGDPDALHLLGTIAYLQEKYAAAADYTRQALEFRPDFTEAHYNLGNALMVQGALDEAIVSYRKAIALQPDYADAFGNLGRALQVQGALDEAIAAYRQALALKPSYVEARENLQRALELQRQQAQSDVSLKSLPSFRQSADSKQHSAAGVGDNGALQSFTQFFNDNNYVPVRDFVSSDICNIASTYTLFKRDLERNIEVGVQQVPNTHSVYGDHLMESIMLHCLPWVEKITGLTLLPTYAQYRVYKPGDELKKHTDRPACQISVSLCLGSHYVDESSDFAWGIWACGKSGVPREYKMQVGDALIYKGLEVLHWREPFQAKAGSYLSQVFLHYVDANGPYAEWKFDKRPRLGAKV